MAVQKSVGTAQVFGALAVGGSPGAPSRQAIIPTLAQTLASIQSRVTTTVPGQSPQFIYGYRGYSFDITTLVQNIASFATATTESIPIPVPGMFAGDWAILTPEFLLPTGVGTHTAVVGPNALTAFGTGTTYIVGSVVPGPAASALATITNYTLTNNSAVVACSAATYAWRGATPAGTHIASGTYIVDVNPGVGFIMSQAATGATSGSMTITLNSIQVCTTASGSSAGATPTWPQTLGGTVTDGGASVWTNFGTAVPVLRLNNTTGSTITSGAGLGGVVHVDWFGLNQ